VSSLILFLCSIPNPFLCSFLSFQKLYDQGARKFWIHNTGPLGCLPQNIALFGKDPSQLDGLHCVAKHNRVAKLFNLQLHALCTKLRGEMSGASITYVDIYTIKYSLIANYSRYGMQLKLSTLCCYQEIPMHSNHLDSLAYYSTRKRCFSIVKYASKRTYNGITTILKVFAIVMNSTCIHMGGKDPNIYMYRKEKIYREHMEKYSNRKSYYTSNPPPPQTHGGSRTLSLER
jgi:hypothetical protein